MWPEITHKRIQLNSGGKKLNPFNSLIEWFSEKIESEVKVLTKRNECMNEASKQNQRWKPSFINRKIEKQYNPMCVTDNYVATMRKTKENLRMSLRVNTYDHFHIKTHKRTHVRLMGISETYISFGKLSKIGSKWYTHFIGAIFTLDKQ